MKKLVVLLLVSFLSVLMLSRALAADGKWILIVTNESDERFFILQDSPQLGTIGDTNVIGVIGKVSDKDGNESEMRWFVSLEGCDSKEGFLVATNSEGKLLFRYPFKITNEATVSVIAEVMCSIAERKVNELEQRPQPEKSNSNHKPYKEAWHKDRRIGAIVV